MSTVPTDPTGASPDGHAGSERTAATTTLQQRFEESRLGRRIISGVIVVLLGTQVVWSMPDSAIRSAMMPVVEPANVIGVNERWSLYAPQVTQRVEELEVDVTMADGSTRIWRHLPNPRLEKVFLPDRWELMASTTVRQQAGRKEFAHWVVDHVTDPSDRPVNVVMMLKFKALAPPGESSTGAPGTKVLYEEALTRQP